MRKVILTIATIATLFSCTKEEIAQTATDTPSEVSKFTGNFNMYKFSLTNEQTGEVTQEVVFDCPRYWTFDEDFNYAERVYELDRGDCVYRYITQNTYSTPEEGVIVIGGTRYELVVVNGADVLKSTNSVGTTKSFYINRI